MDLEKSTLTREQRFWIDRMKTSVIALDEIPVTLASFFFTLQDRGLLEEVEPRIVTLNEQGLRHFFE